MSFSRIIIQLLKTLTPLSSFSQHHRYDFINEHSWSPSTSPECSDGNHNHTFSVKKKSCENQFTDQVLTRYYHGRTTGSNCLAIIEEIQYSLIISKRHYLLPTGDSTFTFILCFFQTHHPPYITQTPGWWPPQEVSPGIYWKNDLIPKKRGPQNVSRDWNHFGLPSTRLKFGYPKLAWGWCFLLTFFDFKKSLKNRRLRKKCWLQMGTFGLKLTDT